MENREFVNERVEEVLESESPRWEKKGRIYSGVAKKFFGKIRALRDRGFSYIQICRGFEKAGLLEADSSPDAFRQAFTRESARRDRESELLREIRDMASAGERAMEAKPMTEVPSVPENLKSARISKITPPPVRQEPPSAKPAPESEEATRERIKMLTTHVVDTGMGKITKYANGTFDYD